MTITPSLTSFSTDDTNSQLFIVFDQERDVPAEEGWPPDGVRGGQRPLRHDGLVGPHARQVLAQSRN